MIGITGGIGAGKSVVSRILRCRGFEVYDCDSEARRIMERSETLRREISERLGAECLTDAGTLCRPAIARIVFADDSCRLWLNSRIHRLVCEDVASRAGSCRTEPFFVESAIMRTSGLDSMCDEIWLVDAPADIRLARACRRDGARPEDISARMKSQATEFSGFDCPEVKVIMNDGHAPLLPRIDTLLANL